MTVKHDPALYTQTRKHLRGNVALRLIRGKGRRERREQLADNVAYFGQRRWNEGLRGPELKLSIRNDVTGETVGFDPFTWIAIIRLILAFVTFMRERKQ